MAAISMTNLRLRSALPRLRDALLGAAVYLAVLPLLSGPGGSLFYGRATAADLLAARAVELTAPPGPGTENAILEAMLEGAATLPAPPAPSTILVLGLTFSLMFAFNLMMVRHLRGAYGVTRRAGLRKGR